MSGPFLPRTARDVFRLRRGEQALYDGLIRFQRAIGGWRYPREAASGDLATMTLLDKVYWLHKTESPIARASRGSGLERHFAAQRPWAGELPAGFSAESTITMSAVGDLMNHPLLAASAGRLYRDVADEIFGADVSMANLECVVAPDATIPLSFSPRAGPRLSYSAADLDAASRHEDRAFTFLATACNHSLDFGADGVRSTMQALELRAIQSHGVNEREEDASRATLVARSGFVVAVISHTFGLNAYEPPSDRPWIVNRTHLNGRPDAVDLTLMEAQIRHAEAQHADAVVLQLHWGFEHELYPRPSQLELAHHLAELGADVIIGHHPHVVQPMERYRTRRDPDREVPIFYSLGNLINPFTADYLCRSRVARVELARGRARDGTARTYVASAGCVEVMQEVDVDVGSIRLVRR